MRGKKPKEREKYVIRLSDSTLVEVNREIYLEWYRSERKERYQKEHDRKYGVCSLEELEEKGGLSEIEIGSINVTEETALRNIDREKLMEALGKLTRQDAYLIWLLYYKEIMVKEAAEIFRCSRKVIGNRRNEILRNLYRMIGEPEI